MSFINFFFLFFQAEDGIRDYKVTGVQTCALPILSYNDANGRDSCYFLKKAEEHTMINRREFFLRTAATAGAAAFANFPHHLFAGTTQKLASDRVKLGPMQVEVSRLAQGSGTDGAGGSSNQTRKLGLRGLAELFDAAY